MLVIQADIFDQTCRNEEGIVRKMSVFIYLNTNRDTAGYLRIQVHAQIQIIRTLFVIYLAASPDKCGWFLAEIPILILL